MLHVVPKQLYNTFALQVVFLAQRVGVTCAILIVISTSLTYVYANILAAIL